jgi:hypothetical protein
MTIQNLKDLLSPIPSFTASTITTFQSGKSIEYPNEGLNNFYPLLYLEEDYLITTIYNNSLPNQEDWNFALLVIDNLDYAASKTDKDNIKDDMLFEARQIVSYLRDQLKASYQGTITSNSYLVIQDYEQDNAHGVRVEIVCRTVTGENKCNFN